ncbi:hypothetical protein ACEPAF_5872 [Sanghuangporus sanghuang]
MADSPGLIDLGDAREAGCTSSLTSKLSPGALRLTKFLSVKRLSQRRLLKRLTRQAQSYWSRFEKSGNREDLDLAISYLQAALDSCSTDHPGRSTALHWLGYLLHTRHERWGEVGDLERAVTLNRAVVELRPEGHPDHSTSLSNLASSLWTRFEYRRRMDDLEEINEGASTGGSSVSFFVTA